MKLKFMFFCFYVMILSFSEIQGQNNYCGCYKYSNNNKFCEEICLNPNGVFIYTLDREFIHIKIEGNWQIRDSLLILDSRHQRDRLIVQERRKKGKNVQLKVRTKSNGLMHYHLYVIYQGGDTLVYKDQWDYTEIPEGIISFYLVDTKGLYSPKYNVEGDRTNYIDVLFETNRVFENEAWELTPNGIIPRGLNCKLQNYILLKKN